MKTYAVTGATGNTGNVVARRLLEEGNTVRVIGRNRERLASLVEKGARAHVGSMDDEDFLTEAFTGADALYAMIPPDLRAENLRAHQNEVGEAIANAIKKAGVKHVVNLSSLGAHLPDKNGPIAGLHDQEQRLNKLEGVHILHLRPTFFFENLLAGIGIIKNMGVNGSPLRADLEVPLIAAQDIGRFAAERLSKLDFTGHTTRELLGQRNLSMTEATKILGKSIGKEALAYTQFRYEDAEKAMLGMGMSASVVSAFIEMYKGFNEGWIRGEETRSEENTTETSIEDFAPAFAAAYQS